MMRLVRRVTRQIAELSRDSQTGPLWAPGFSLAPVNNQLVLISESGVCLY